MCRNYYKKREIVFASFSALVHGNHILPHFIHLYMDTISCTKYIKTSYVQPKWLTEQKNYAIILTRAAH